MFTAVCLCVCQSVCLCVRVSCEQNSSRTDEPIWTRFSLKGHNYRSNVTDVEVYAFSECFLLNLDLHCNSVYVRFISTAVSSLEVGLDLIH